MKMGMAQNSYEQTERAGLGVNKFGRRAKLGLISKVHTQVKFNWTSVNTINNNSNYRINKIANRMLVFFLSSKCVMYGLTPNKLCVYFSLINHRLWMWSERQDWNPGSRWIILNNLCHDGAWWEKYYSLTAQSLISKSSMRIYAKSGSVSHASLWFPNQTHSRVVILLLDMGHKKQQTSKWGNWESQIRLGSWELLLRIAKLRDWDGPNQKKQAAGKENWFKEALLSREKIICQNISARPMKGKMKQVQQSKKENWKREKGKTRRTPNEMTIVQTFSKAWWNTKGIFRAEGD